MANGLSKIAHPDGMDEFIGRLEPVGQTSGDDTRSASENSAAYEYAGGKVQEENHTEDMEETATPPKRRGRLMCKRDIIEAQKARRAAAGKADPASKSERKTVLKALKRMERLFKEERPEYLELIRNTIARVQQRTPASRGYAAFSVLAFLEEEVSGNLGAMSNYPMTSDLYTSNGSGRNAREGQEMDVTSLSVNAYPTNTVSEASRRLPEDYRPTFWPTDEEIRERLASLAGTRTYWRAV